MRNRSTAVVAALALIGVLGIVVVLGSLHDKLPVLPLFGRACVVRADGTVTLNSEQMANAATIAAVGIRRDMPDRAIVVALATAYQESHLENLDDGDRDSVGLFQQRPSQGWGTREEIMDPRHAAGSFYHTLKRVKGWQSMRVTDAAQKVQRSAYPNAYEKWADEAAVLTTALIGHATGAVACTVTGDPVVRGEAAASGLAQGLRLDWGKALNARTTRQTGAATRSEPGSAAGLTLRVDDTRTGWRYAHWLVSHAGENGVERVRFGDLEWHAPAGKWERAADDRAAGGARVVAEVFR
ncbi:MAG TPA: hypothetical protein VFO77_11200 [Actinoplanes sp.]|nr:hypothetical protein [Actinoplanes sp.]